MQKHTISLCMIVKNEEKYLARCLESVQGKVDEIIIVDTGSTDSTVEIAKKFGANVKHYTWINDFAAARNYSIIEAKSNYILVLDADEYLDENANLQKDLEQNKDYYRLMIKNYKGLGKADFHRNIRLYKAGIGLRYSGKLHEQLNTYDKDSIYTGTESDIVIHHIGYLPELIAERDKKKRNYDIMLAELKENPTGFSYYNMGITYMNDEQYDKALDMFRQSYPLSKSKTYVKDLFVRMGECLSRAGRTEEGIKLLLDASRAFPAYTDLHFTLGRLFMEYGYLRDAEYQFRICLELGEKVENVTTEGIGSYLANYNLALAYEKMGRRGEAFEEAYAAIVRNKSFSPALSLYIKLMQQSGIHQDEIKKQIGEVYPIVNVEELNILIFALYEIHNPLLCEYESVFGSDELTDIRAVAMLLNKNYAGSLKEWEKKDVIPQPNIIDAAVLCMLTKDIQLFNKLKASRFLSDKEWETIRIILLRENHDKLSLTVDVESFLLAVGECLININEYEQFEYISAFILQCSIETQEKLTSILLTNGYYDIALELIGLLIEKHPGRFESIIIMGEAFMRQNKCREALEYFAQGLHLKQDYSVYEKIYNIYEGLGLEEKINDLKSMMRERFPLSVWLKEV